MATTGVPESIQILKVTASSNYDVGFKIGRAFGQFFTLNSASEIGQSLQKFYNSNEGKPMFDEYLAKTTECYPNIVEEIRGMADGSGTPFDKLFLDSMISEITFSTDCKNTENDVEDEVAGCTDVLVNTDTCRIIGHNEDWSIDVSSKAFLIDVELHRSNTELKEQHHNECDISESLKSRNDRFMSFVFPGVLAGSTFAMNKHFVFTVNTLVPKKVNKGSVILFALLRVLLSCETIEECVKVLEAKPYGCSYGININVASIETTDMWSIEVYPNKGQTIVDLLHLPQQTDGADRKQYVHTNHYKHIPEVEERECLEGSKARESVASEAPVPTCVADVCNILGDRSSHVQSIYRIPSADKKVGTVTSAVFDLNAMELLLFLGNPGKEDNLESTIPFLV